MRIPIRRVLTAAVCLAAGFIINSIRAQSTYTPYAFTTLAGMPGVSGSADGTGGAARFNGPPGVAVDGAGNVYVADSTNEIIRRVTSGGVVTTLAGLAGSPGSADGTGSAARFSAPTGVAVDGAGNVYVGDAGNALIRKVTPAGVVTTLAGLAGATGGADGTGSAARFNQPAGVAVDSAGNVYVADYFNDTIRKVTPGGVVTTLAGLAGQAGSADGTGSAARFYAPFAVAVDAVGNVYVADQFNQTIRQITPAGLVTTLAGQAGHPGSADGTGSAARFSAPSGVAVDAAGNVYVGDQLNETLRKITPGGAVTTLAGLVGSAGSADGIGEAARFNKPCGVAVDSAGYLYVADAWNNRITKGAPASIPAPAACAPVPAGLVGWWAGEGNANDTTGANNGLLQGGVTFVPGEAGQAFSFDGATGDVEVPASASLNLGTGGGITIELWIKPLDVSTGQPLVEWNNGSFGVLLDIDVPVSVGGAGPGSFCGYFKDITNAGHPVNSPPGALKTGIFQHVAVTYDKASGEAAAYLNGVLVGQAFLGAFTPMTLGNLYLGWRPFDAGAGLRYAGLMDEVSLYDRALSAAEIQAIFAAGSSGKCALPPVIAAPVIFGQPQSQTAAAGGTATFSVGANGTPPLSYQWQRNGANLPGATGSSLVLTDVQLAEAGVYSVFVSNAAGAVTSSGATLTVSAPGACAPVPAGLAGWWAGEGNANDSTGVNNGVLQGGVTFVPGEVGQAFSFDGATGDVEVPASASLNLGTGGGMTIELWIKPVDVLTNEPLVEWNNGSFGVLLDIDVPVSVGGAGPGSFCGYFKDITLAGHAVNSPPGALKTGIFQHVAVTYDKANGYAAAYLNGVVVGQVFLGAFTPMTLGNLYLGWRPFDAAAGIRYAGLMDEVSLYNRALSAAEIQAIFAAGSLGKCALPPVIAAPVIVGQPQSQTVSVGGTATFSVGANGSPPLSYQWERNGTYLSGATSSSLVLADVQLAEAGVYSVIVSNAAGAVTSSGATLTVSAPGACAPVPAGLVAWWAGEGNANDSTGANNGVLQGGVTFVPGEVGQAFNFDGTTADVKIPANANLNVGAGNGLTIETWMKPSDPSQLRPLAEWNSGDTSIPYPYGVHFWISVPPPDGTGAGCLFGNVRDTLGASHEIASAAGLLTTTAFQHVALTYFKTTGLAVIYLNGAAVAQQNLGAFTPLTTSDLYLGYRPAGLSVGQRFVGQMDEVSLYNRALSAAEIQAIFAAGSSGKCALPPVIAAPVILDEPQSQTVAAGGTATFSVGANGSPPLSYQWQLNGANLAGATGSSLVLANVQLAEAGVYSVIVSNAAGAVTSSGATLTVSVQTANALLFAARTGSGAQFSQVLVPIDVNLFTNILTFQFSLHWDPTVATYVDVEQFGLPGLGAGSFGTGMANSGTLTVSWDDPTGSGQSLGDGTAVFAIRFALIGNEGAASAVTMDGTPTALQAAKSDLTLVPVQTSPGRLSVALAPKVVIGGHVMYYPTNYPPSGPSAQAVAGVTVNLTGATNLNQATATDGSYSFPGLAPGLAYEVSPAKPDDEPPANGVTTLGIALIRRQILDLAPLASPYALLAADVNASGTVDTLDIALIRRLILALTNTFPAGLWRFVPADYLFPDPSNPWAAPSIRWYTNPLADLAGQDYVAIKLGDVNHSWVSPGGGPKVRLPRETEPGLQANPELSAVRFEARGQVVQRGQRVAVRVSVGGFTGGTTAQFSLGWDATVLRYAGVGEFGVRGLGEDNFGAALAGSGRLTFSWDDPAGTGLEAADGGPLFTVYFDVIGAAGSVSPVAFEDWPTVREATVDLVPRALASWDGQVIVAGKRPGLVYGGDAAKGSFRISVPSVPGRQYILEFTDSLSGGHWRGLDAVVGDGSVKTLADPTATTQPRLYRLRVE